VLEFKIGDQWQEWAEKPKLSVQIRCVSFNKKVQKQVTGCRVAMDDGSAPKSVASKCFTRLMPQKLLWTCRGSFGPREKVTKIEENSSQNTMRAILSGLRFCKVTDEIDGLTTTKGL